MNQGPDQKVINMRNSDGKVRLAVIDDEDQWLRVFERMFRNSGYRLDTFSDPQAFLQAISNDPEHYAGVICDLKMPGINGRQIFETLKANPVTADIPFVLVSGVLTEDYNLFRVQGMAHVSKMDGNLRSRIFDELIEIIENWPHLVRYLQGHRVAARDIKFFQQFYVNYHLFFGRILEFVRQMEAACVKADAGETARVRAGCDRYMEDLLQRCMDLVGLAQNCPQGSHFVAKVCARARTSLNMLFLFRLLLNESAPEDSAFPALLDECRQNLEKIIQGSEKGYNLRELK